MYTIGTNPIRIDKIDDENLSAFLVAVLLNRLGGSVIITIEEAAKLEVGWSSKKLIKSMEDDKSFKFCLDESENLIVKSKNLVRGIFGGERKKLALESSNK